MRQRKIKGAKEMIAANTRYYIEDPTNHKGSWHKVFNNDNPIVLEIGSGKGKFITELATLNPNINYIGLEKFDNVLLRLSQKLETKELDNIKIIREDASNLLEMFSENEIDTILLNFSDPWPKNSYKKRRLTHENFLLKYKNILKEDGKIIFKTDNRLLFEFSLMEFAKMKMDVLNISLDLHQSDIFNIKTEYEEKFEDKGPIYYIEIKF